MSILLASQRVFSRDFHSLITKEIASFQYIDMEINKGIKGYLGPASNRLYLYLDDTPLCNIPKEYADNWCKVFFKHYKRLLASRGKA